MRSKDNVEIFIDWFIGISTVGLESLHVSAWLIDLITEGVIGGVGGIITFLPNIIILFLALAFLEDSGYMARVAYVMNDIMDKLGLSGRAFIPMVLGFGCTVPAIMASRTLESKKDRERVMLITRLCPVVQNCLYISYLVECSLVSMRCLQHIQCT